MTPRSAFSPPTTRTHQRGRRCEPDRSSRRLRARRGLAGRYRGRLSRSRPASRLARDLSGGQLALGADPVLELVAAAVFEGDEVGALGDVGVAGLGPLGLGLRRTDASRDGLG